MIIVRDIALGIQGHFHARMTEWIMSIPTAMTAFGFYIQPDMFSISPSYNVIGYWATEQTWMLIITFCYFARMAALVINGTFQQFRHSPHIRVTASVICLQFWGWITYGFLIAFLLGEGAFFAVPVCFTLSMIEGLNVYRGMSDVRAHHEDLKRTGRWKQYPSSRP